MVSNIIRCFIDDKVVFKLDLAIFLLILKMLVDLALVQRLFFIMAHMVVKQ